MRRGILLGGVLFVAGCGVDPGKGRLEPATRAMLYSPDRSAVEVVFEEPWAGTTLHVPRPLPAGLPVVVASDSEDGPSESDRPVIVNIREGEHRGQCGRVNRKNLRPFSRK